MLTAKRKKYVIAINDPEENEPKELIKILSERPPTYLSVSQGDHVSAYRLICQIIYSALEDCSASEAYYKLVALVFGLEKLLKLDPDLPEQYAKIRERKANNSLFLSPEELQAKALKFQETREEDKMHDLYQTQANLELAYFAKIADVFLTKYNKMPKITYPKEGNLAPPLNEGAKVKKAIKTLNVIHASLPEDDNKVVSAVDVDKIAVAMSDLFWYPEIPDSVKIDVKSNTGREEWKLIRENKRYSDEVRPRDNDKAKLYQAAVEHIDLIFVCYPRFHSAAQQSNIVQSFLRQAACSWKKEKRDEKFEMNFYREVNLLLPVYWRDYEISASDEETSSSERSDPDNSPADNFQKDEGTPLDWSNILTEEYESSPATSDEEIGISTHKDKKSRLT